MTSATHCSACRSIFDPDIWPECPGCGEVATVVMEPGYLERITREAVAGIDDETWERIKTWRDSLARREQSDGSR